MQSSRSIHRGGFLSSFGMTALFVFQLTENRLLLFYKFLYDSMIIFFDIQNIVSFFEL
jgi:hypothetical protein